MGKSLRKEPERIMSSIITRPSKPGKKLLSVNLTLSVPSIVVLIVSSLVDSKHKRCKSSHNPGQVPAGGYSSVSIK
jgi:hypothetical protein